MDVAAARFAVEQQLARDAADSRIGQGRDERPQRVSGKGLPRVGEDENLVPCGRDSRIEGARLAARRQENRVDCGRDSFGACPPFVGGSVGDDDDLHAARPGSRTASRLSRRARSARASFRAATTIDIGGVTASRRTGLGASRAQAASTAGYPT